MLKSLEALLSGELHGTTTDNNRKRLTDIATYRLNRPKGRFSENGSNVTGGLSISCLSCLLLRQELALPVQGLAGNR